MAVMMPNMAKKDTKLTFKSKNKITEGGSLKIQLTDMNGTAISNQTVNITITDKDSSSSYYSVVTNKNGTGSLKLDKDPGNYNVTVTYSGNDNYTGCNASKKIKIEEEAVESESAEQVDASTSASSDDGNYYNGYSRSDFAPGEQAAIDEALANGYDSPAAYYQATGKQAGQAYMDAHPEEAGPRV